jgi:hypothetical protein
MMRQAPRNLTKQSVEEMAPQVAGPNSSCSIVRFQKILQYDFGICTMERSAISIAFENLFGLRNGALCRPFCPRSLSLRFSDVVSS